MPKDYFQWLAVLFICQEEHRQTAYCAKAETKDLTLGQAEKKLGFDFCQILGDRHICHGLFPPFISVSER